MKIRRSRFEHLIKIYPNHKLYSIGKDKYLEVRGTKYILRNIFEVLKDIMSLPLGFLFCIVGFITEIPKWSANLLMDLKQCCPIGYIKVEDDEKIQVMK